MYICPNCKAKLSSMPATCPVCKTVIERQPGNSNYSEITGPENRLKGGMGVLVKGIHRILNYKLIYKYIRKDVIANPYAFAINRAEQEAAILVVNARLNIPRILYCSLKENNDNPHIIMKFAEGQSLSSIIQRDRHIGLNRILTISRQICDVLGQLHNNGVIHRDLKPDNIIINTYPGLGEWVTVLDFGISKVEKAGITGVQKLHMGTIDYMAPEQIDDVSNVFPQSDLYSLGLILYEMLCGENPIRMGHGASIKERQLNFMPVAPSKYSARNDIPLALDRVILKCLAKNYKERYQSAIDCYLAIEESLKDYPKPVIADWISSPRPAPPGSIQLIIKHIKGSLAGKVQTFGEGRIKIGRKKETCDIAFDDIKEGKVSREHGTLYYENGNLYYIDHSSNGTWINEQRAQPNIKIKISKGDRIRLCSAGPELIIMNC